MLVNPYIYGGSNNLVTTLYTGTGSARSIVTGQNLAAGALVWGKSRGPGGHYLFDTERGATKFIQSHSANAEGTSANSLTAFNSNGFNLGTGNELNQPADDFVGWSFLKKAGFLDIVEYVGNDIIRTISHGLGSEVGMMIIKRIDIAGNWAVYHRQSGNTVHGTLNSASAFIDDHTFWNDTSPTSTVFTVASASDVNTGSATYIAYLFAHNPAQKIFCGSFTTDGSGNATVTGLGFRPKWLLVKRSNGTSNWFLIDNERGTENKMLFPNNSAAETSGYSWTFNSDGFTINTGFPAEIGAYIFMAVG